MRAALGILVTTGALAVVPGDIHMNDLPDPRAAQGTSGARAALAVFAAPDPERARGQHARRGSPVRRPASPPYRR